MLLTHYCLNAKFLCTFIGLILMLFNSVVFICAFLPITFFVYFELLKRRMVLGAKAWLVCASLFFYGYWKISYLPLILFSIVFNFIVGSAISKETIAVRVNKKAWLIFGILFNIALLAYYKYADFFIENVNLLTGSEIALLHVVLPLAISFFTFQQIAYLVDSYHGLTKEYDFLTYALFVSFFPQLIAGPIVHHKEVIPQFSKISNFAKNYKNIASGIFVFLIGLFKKVMVADTLSVYVARGFNGISALNMAEAWFTSLAYTMQIYYDFSGYCDMAIGAALLFNIHLPINFNSPYKSLNIQDFWRRWHMTLSKFLRDYIYIPLGGNRKSPFKTYANLVTVFLVGGFWHGASWTFVMWGALHGAATVVHRLWRLLAIEMPRWLAWFITFNFINVTWIFFRANKISDAFLLLGKMFDVASIQHLEMYKIKFLFENLGVRSKEFEYLLLAFLATILLKNSIELLSGFEIKDNRKCCYYGAAIGTGLAVLISKIVFVPYTEFIYFNF